jgi:hypothetical protein
MGCGGRGCVLRATGSQGGFFESVSGQQHADERRLQRTAKSRGPAPTRASSSRILSRSYRGFKIVSENNDAVEIRIGQRIERAVSVRVAAAVAVVTFVRDVRTLS